jgi:hypothetical protein
MDVKMSSDIPLPTPRSVTTSPSHMMSPVPAVSVMIMMRMVAMLSLGTRSEAQLVKRPPGFRAMATSVVDCRIARPMVR